LVSAAGSTTLTSQAKGVNNTQNILSFNYLEGRKLITIIENNILRYIFEPQKDQVRNLTVKQYMFHMCMPVNETPPEIHFICLGNKKICCFIKA
jgi:hypothetical protein